MMPSFERLLDLEVVRRHAVAGAAIDDDRFGGAQALGGARGIDRGIAAAIDDDAAAEQRLVLAFHRAQHRDGVEHLRGGAGRNKGALADMGADGEEGGVELAGLHGVEDVVDLGVELELDADIEDPLHFRIEHVARQAVFRNAEAHHAAGGGPGIVDRHSMAHAAQMIGGGQAGRTGADDQHALAAFRLRRRESPAALDRLVAEETLDRIDADGFVDLRAVAGGFAGMIADAAHHRGQRIVLRQHAPGVFVVAGFGVIEPGLDVLAGRAGVVAGRQTIDIDRPLGAPGAGLVGEARADVEGDGEGMVHQASSSGSSRRYSAMLRSAIACSRPRRFLPSSESNRWAKRFCGFR